MHKGSMGRRFNGSLGLESFVMHDGLSRHLLRTVHSGHCAILQIIISIKCTAIRLTLHSL